MNLNDIIRTRHTSKAYDNSRKLTAEQQQQLLDLLRFSPSSVNSQPWHFFAVTSDEGKQQILPALMDANQVKARNAAMTVVFTIKEELTKRICYSCWKKSSRMAVMTAKKRARATTKAAVTSWA